MNIRISRRLRSLSDYAFAEVDKAVENLKKRGFRPIDFGVGDPKDDTPVIVRNSIKKAVDRRKNSGYPSYVGSEEFRQEVSGWCKKRFGVNLSYEREIISTIGAKETIFNFPEAFVNPGDYVIMPNPGYPPYERGTMFAEGKCYLLPLLKENNFLMDFESIPQKILKKTKILWINYPNNPTGAVASKEYLKEAIGFGRKHKILVASDECYSEIYFKEKPHSILEFSKEGVVAFQSLSKRSAMTGYRIGWAAGDEKIISALKKLKPNIDSGTPTFIQDAAITALRDEKHVKKMRENYRLKRDILIEALTSLGLEECNSEATLYVWQRVPKSMNALSFTKKLLQENMAVVVTPGSWISKTINGSNPGDDYVRFALVPTVAETKEAARRIKAYF